MKSRKENNEKNKFRLNLLKKETLPYYQEFIEYFIKHLCEISYHYQPCKMENEEQRSFYILNYLLTHIIPFYDIWALTYNGKIVGFAVVLPGPDTSCLTYLYIDKKYRGRRLGLSTLKILENHYGKLHLYIEEERSKERIPFYKKAGFKVVDSKEEKGAKYLKLANWK
ncbi:GNAT family N-acetyltransferase [Balnearium lithotrophicum]|uniref:GNAT family N-acetyltransferase n=1 Tax=Balnearium lithotrophicum TaxID=223788 RepID=UPI00319DB5FA